MHFPPGNESGNALETVSRLRHIAKPQAEGHGRNVYKSAAWAIFWALAGL